MARVAKVNAAALWSLAKAPGMPRDVQVDISELTNDTTLLWTANDEPDLAARGPLGFPVIADYAHVRRSRSEDPLERIHRRVYNYDLPVAGAWGTRGRGATTGGVSDAGMVFAAHCADVDRQFVPIQRRLDELDMLNAWTTPVGSAVFAVPPGCPEGGFVGDVLFED